jgi:hypothetical protein
MFIGNQTGGRVFLFLYTDNLKRDYDLLVTKGVKVVTRVTKVMEEFLFLVIYMEIYGT